MHTFGIGGDDRKYLSMISLKAAKQNIIVQHEPQNLYELFDTYSSSEACVGMRYHSVVFQTLLNGNNFILDYTTPRKGKITGFLEMLDNDFYRSRVVNLQSDPLSSQTVESCITLLKGGEVYNFDPSILEQTFEFYRNKVCELLNK